MFGLAAVAAVAAMAFIGVSGASANEATALCKVKELPCAVGNQWKEKEKFHSLAENPLLDSSSVNVLCKYSLVTAESLGLAAKGTRLLVHILELKWIECHTHGGTNCTVTTVLLPLLLVLKLSNTDAHVQSTKNATGGLGTVLVECGIFIHCSYAGEPTLLAEGDPADLTANTVVTASTAHDSFFCPEKSTWLALYKSLANENVYISS
jgi:hypothetical protein